MDDAKATLRELFEMVGVDVARYFFLMRKPEAQLVFDLDMALDQSEKNPVYKVQYAHARMCSIFAKAGGAETDRAVAGRADLSLLEHPTELALVKALAEFPDVVERAAEQRAPHLLCEYLEQTAGAVNSWYHAGNPSRNPELAVLVKDESLRAARLREAPADPAFVSRLPEYVEQARAYLGDGRLVARCRPEIAGRLRALAARDGGFTVVEDPGAGTGIRLALEDGAVEVDNTLEARLARLQARLALEVLRRVERGH